ncbi:MAG: cbb3-type cytochrome c oxidase subunit 3 [Chlorobi bacterium]|nr:cbb3-type cytochrome c oxidase subunit 3 [Chlorobiota bacterium]
MFSSYLSAIDGIEVFPIISLIIFVTVFLIVLIRVFAMDKKSAVEAANIPLKDEILTTKSESKNG